MNAKEKSYLLRLARKAIGSYLKDRSLLKVAESDLPSDRLLTSQRSFVTLTINNQLRGCIGYLEGANPLYQDVSQNAVSAAFFDPRFPPLRAEELPNVVIEISLLSVPKKYFYRSSSELLNYLRLEKPGVLLEKGTCRATYLPQVWEELPKAENFLTELCQKAGLAPNAWEKERLTISTYQTVVFREK